MDVVALAQHGVEYAVATLGTATTAQHVQKLMRQVDEVIFCFDGDEAGRRAAWRALEQSLGILSDGKQVRFLFLPQGEDPDSYVRKSGAAAFETMVADAPPLSRFLLEELARRVDLATAEGRAGLIHQAKPLLRQMPANALRVQLVREVAALARMAPEEVEQLCELPAMVARALSAPRAPRAAPAPIAQQLLRLFIGNPPLARSISEDQRHLIEGDPELAPVSTLVELLQSSGADSLGAAFEALRESQYGELYAAVAGETLLANPEEDAARADLQALFTKLEVGRLTLEFDRLSTRPAPTEAERVRFTEV